MRTKKTKLMRKAEEKIGQPLERALPRLVDEHGMAGAADVLEVSKATIGYWMLKLGIRTERVAVSPGETIVVRKTA